MLDIVRILWDQEDHFAWLGRTATTTWKLCIGRFNWCGSQSHDKSKRTDCLSVLEKEHDRENHY
jgi:hypothetical protein